MFRPKEPTLKLLQESKRDDDGQFSWGLTKGDVKLYQSFSFDGIVYSLYDCVYLWRKGQAEPDIGKLVRILETESHERKVEVVWFFRPSEIANWLGDIKPRRKEIFLGCGHGEGLSNLNSLEAISGKCNVVCSSKDKRNPQPTEEELKKADYIFCRTFDVGKYIISENFPSSIGDVEVVNFFNMRRCKKPSVCSKPEAHPKVRNEELPVSATKNDQSTRVEKGGHSTSTSRQINCSAKNGPCARADLKRSNQSANPSDTSRLKKRKLLVSSGLDEGSGDDTLPCAPPGGSVQENHIITKDSCRENQDHFIRESFDNKASKFTEKELGSKQHVHQGTSTSRQIHCSAKNGPCARADLKRSNQSANPSDTSRLKKRKLLVSSDEGSGDDTLPCAPPGGSVQENPIITKDFRRENQDHFIRESFDNKASKFTEKELGSKQHVHQGTSTSRQINCSAKNGPCARADLKRSNQSANPSDTSRLKKRKLLVSSDEGSGDDTLPCAPPGGSVQENHIITKDSCRGNQDHFIRESFDNKASKFTEKELGSKQHVRQGMGYKYIEVTRKPVMESSKWLKLEVWSEERLSEAIEKEILVVLENLDPSLTSAEVEDIMWNVFGQKVKAKMVQHTAFSSPHSGQALVIFKTKEAADKVISELIRGCLVLGDGKPIVGRRRILKKFGASGKFPGHLSIDRSRIQKQNEETRKAVATSHHAQGNTIEFEMALEWRLLQDQSDLWWRALHEEQRKEIETLMKRMKTHHNE